MKILVIGGAGYIGSHVVQELLERGFAVTVYDNLSSGLRQNLFPQAGFAYGSIMDYSELSRVCRAGFDAVVHLAAFKAAGESMREPEKYSLNNISGTVNILNAMAESGIKRLIFSSSAAVYGEPKYLPVDENHPLEPENYYGFTKLEIERFMLWYEKLKGIRFASLRYFNAAGYDVNGRLSGLEQNPANLVPVIMETAVGKQKELLVFGNDYDTRDGTCVRDYVHVNDLASGHAKALDYICKSEKSITVNLGSEKGTTVTEMLEAARRITGRPITARIVARREGDPASLTASSKAAFELLGWTANYSDIETLLGSTWEVYKKR
ncbi:MAG: UDP-glucose 4-epimerase GalE [Treponema sp.]|nr:UDP-glucose 4-epimerase GalE [Treponema sp.]